MACILGEWHGQTMDGHLPEAMEPNQKFIFTVGNDGSFIFAIPEILSV